MSINDIPFKPDAPFKPVVGNPKYIVTETGFVYNLDFRGTGYMRPCSHAIVEPPGYVKAWIWYPDVGKKFVSVHRLVAQAFIPNPLNLSDVDHEDLNKQNNHYTNLSWKTHGDNLAEARKKLGNWSIKNHPSTIQPYQAYQFIDNVPNKGNFLDFPSLKAGAAHFQKPYSTFAPVVHKAMKRGGYAYGYLWRKVVE